MSDDDANGQEPRSWLERLAQAFSSEPRSQEDLLQILRVARANKLLDDDALRIIEGALRVADLQVRDIMVPRSRMVVVRVDDSLDDVLGVAVESNHSRFPVVGESLDDVRGILLAKDLLKVALAGKESFCLERLLRPATIVPESKRLNVLLREFRERRYHMAVVVDEYGSVAGLVTIEDVLEEIVGEIEDETDEEEFEPIQRRPDGSALVSALTPIEEFNEAFDAGFSDEEFDTIGGVLLKAFGGFPKVGEQITLDGFTFTVADGDSRQIRLVEVRPPATR
ncbi:MAG: ion transporter [Porticoccaceae bacterium]|nr:MAG: ion transporter [Porticoccaceae bacterium]